MTDIEYRIEHDTMGEVRVPKNALYAAQTQRAVENFPISGDALDPAQRHLGVEARPRTRVRGRGGEDHARGQRAAAYSRRRAKAESARP